MSRGKFLTQKESRRERDYGLPRLTIAEFAREVGATPEEITVWLADLLYQKIIKPSQWSRWTRNSEPIADAILGLFLVQRRQEAPTDPVVPLDETSKKKEIVSRIKKRSGGGVGGRGAQS